MRVEDLKVLSNLEVSMNRVLTPSLMRDLMENSTSLDNLLTFLSGFEISKCVEERIDTSAPLSYVVIRGKLRECWMRDLINRLHLMKASRKLLNFVELFTLKENIVDLFTSLRLGEPDTAYSRIAREVSSTLLSSTEVTEATYRLRALRNPLGTLVSVALRRTGWRRVRDIDWWFLEDRVLEEYWGKLLELGKSLKPTYRLTKCLSTSRKFTGYKIRVREVLIKGGDVTPLLRVLGAGIAEAVRRLGGDPVSVDLLLNVVDFKLCHDMLRYGPLTYDVLLKYLLLKEFELTQVSYTLYLLLQELPDSILKLSLGRWVEIHEFLH